MSKSTYDKSIKVGDIVTAYHAGYHRVLKIEDRNASTTLGGKPYKPSPLVTLELLLDSNGKKARRKETSCDISWCTKIDMNKVNEIITYDLEFFVNKKRNLIALVTGS